MSLTKAILVGLVLLLTPCAPFAAGREGASGGESGRPSAEARETGSATTKDAPVVRITLHPTASIPAGQGIRLGDVAEIEGPAAERAREVALGLAPAPGQRRALSRLSVLRYLEVAGIPRAEVILAGAPQLRVSGLGQHLDEARVREAVARAVAGLVSGGEVKLESVQLPAGVQLPPGEYQVRATPAPSAIRSGTNRLAIELVWPDGRRRRMGVYARMKVSGPMVVAARDIPRGERVRPADLRMEVRDYPRGAPVLRDADAAVGQVARTTLRQGQPLREASLQRARAVEAGQTVVASYRDGAVELEYETRARGSGNVGGLIRIVGQDGRSSVRARIVAPGRVVVVGSEEER